MEETNINTENNKDLNVNEIIEKITKDSNGKHVDKIANLRTSIGELFTELVIIEKTLTVEELKTYLHYYVDKSM